MYGHKFICFVLFTFSELYFLLFILFYMSRKKKSVKMYSFKKNCNPTKNSFFFWIEKELEALLGFTADRFTLTYCSANKVSLDRNLGKICNRGTDSEKKKKIDR